MQSLQRTSSPSGLQAVCIACNSHPIDSLYYTGQLEPPLGISHVEVASKDILLSDRDNSVLVLCIYVHMRRG
jgi:hypothetical protein